MAIAVELRQSGIWQTNSVVVDGGAGCVVIDPAFFPRELDELAQVAAARGGAAAVVFTHGHWDHVAGWRHFPGATVYGSPSLAAAVASDGEPARKNLADLRDFDGRWYIERGAPASWPPSVSALVEGAALLAGIALEALALPGHSGDGLALVVPEAGLLLPGDYLSPCEIPFVEDLAAYRATLRRLIDVAGRVERVIPGHGRVLASDEARAIAEADLAYLEALAGCVARGDREGAEGLALPRAAGVPGMREHHLDNCRAAFSV